MNLQSNVDGLRLEEAGVADLTAVARAFATALPVTEELEQRPDVTILVRCIPMLEVGAVTGGLLLLRDVSDIRRRDRLLLSKDAAIREVHHRVKNNLQTISSLLHLQARRVEAYDARKALEEAERRVRSIALVHEILSRGATEDVEFNEILPALVRIAEDIAEPPVGARFTYSGDAGELPAEVATPLAVILNELLQNAAEHADPDGRREGVPLVVEIRLSRGEGAVEVEVRDNGGGLPAGFSIDETRSLGLSIVRDLVRTQLGGTIEMRNDHGTVVDLEIPVKVRPDSLASLTQ
jgi:two-component sensor histidine kinase